MLTTFTVTNLDDVGDGSLRDAIDEANTMPGPDEIVFAPGVHGTIGLASQLEITDDLAINGPGQDKLNVSGLEQTRVFNIAGAEVQIDHLTISDGLADSSVGFPVAGGGILNSGGTLSLDHVVMGNNAAVGASFGGGGAVFNLFGTLDVSHSSFENNRATNSDGTDPVAGGAIASVLSNTDISYSRFTNNELDAGPATGSGGAISATFGGTLLVSHSQFVGNSVSSDVDARGGAISAAFEGNPAIPFLSVFVTVDHSHFVGNSAEGALARGGAIYTEVSSFGLDSSTIVHNMVEGTNAQGGGIYSGSGATNAASVTLTRTNVNANRAIGDTGGDGVGGGVYNVGTFEIDKVSNVHGNKATTSHDNVFGSLDLLAELLAA